MSKWNNLSMKERASYILTAIKNGIYNRQLIIDAYNKFEDGGFKGRIIEAVPAREYGVSDYKYNYDTGQIEEIIQPLEGTKEVLDAVSKFINNQKLGKKNLELAKKIVEQNRYVPLSRNIDAEEAIAIIREGDIDEINSLGLSDYANNFLLDDANAYLNHADALNKYLGISEMGRLEKSPYAPTIAKDNNMDYYRFVNQSSNRYWDPVINEMVQPFAEKSRQFMDPTLATFTASRGRDDGGDYVSIYDIWDYNSKVLGTPGDNIAKWIGGKPFEIYDRVYLDDYYDIPEGHRGNYILPELTVEGYYIDKDTENENY